MLAFSLFIILSCSGIAGAADDIINPSARELYKRELKDNQPVYIQWELAYKNAVTDSLLVRLPYGEKGGFIPYQNSAHSYIINLTEGEKLITEIEMDSVDHRVFIDILELKDSVFVPVQNSKQGESRLSFEPKYTGSYKIIIQPEAKVNTNFFISLNIQPLYGFPVAGKGNSDIGSFWGMERDEGKRRHEGIDIFAKKGTPVVAVTDGSISRTGEYGIGGKQVWLRAGLFGNALYYAHLDSIAVKQGMKVKAGDTLGYVGNTGNARFTPPHLHFGIYKNGAVNPLPFVYKTQNIAARDFPKSYNGINLKTKNKANLRMGPSTTYKAIGSLEPNEAVMLLGQHKDWLHVLIKGNKKAYLHKSLVKEIN